MKRKILLLEPKYRNKYPPIGLMKIATYHRILGDEVTFFKGDVKDLVLDHLTEECILRLNNIGETKNWCKDYQEIRSFIKTKRNSFFDELNVKDRKHEFLIINCLENYSAIYRKKDYSLFPKWDRVYVTTLFTFYWKVTIEAINYAKYLVNDPKELLVGGVLASLLHEELESETGIKPHRGLLDKPGMLDPDNLQAQSLIIDNLPLDYSILDEIDYKYPTGSAYFTFMTKGCTRKCAFCSVPILEPTYKPKIDTIDKFAEVKELFGEQQNLLLMDNNVLASPLFPNIIQEIKDMGFSKGAVYSEPNQLDIAVNNLKAGINDKAYVKRTFRLLNDLLNRIKGSQQQDYYNLLEKYELLKIETATKKAILEAYEEFKDIYEQFRPKTLKQRYVDFNQGTDARYVTDELMKLISEISIRPLRIAFDQIATKAKYENAVRLAAKYGIRELSNYLLYNFKDKPDDLYARLEINVQLNEELGINIYSFPMKYIPLFGEDAKNRDYIGPYWNKKFIRAIQSILNVTKGIVAPGSTFFRRAFGKDVNEYHEILHMPETYIIYRYFYEGNGHTEHWRNLFNQLLSQETEEKELTLEIIRSNDFKNYEEKVSHPLSLELLRHYTIRRDDVHKVEAKDVEYKSTKKQFDKLIHEDQFIDLTLTYDHETV